jgi:Holliday junction resolvase
MRAKRVDANQKDICHALKTFGASIVDLSGVGKGCPDLLIGFKGKTYLIEIKRNSTAKFTPQQLQFNESWTGGIIARIENIDQAIALLTD